ncbi:MAG TPA: hypothetical protein VGH99_01120 [Pseudonocardia sp.]|jgi:hypothetical protein
MDGFTLALCRSPGCAHAGDDGTRAHAAATGPGRGSGAAGPRTLDEMLAEATRCSEHGVLLVTACLLGSTLCRACGPAAAGRPVTTGLEPAHEHGRVAVVQPCRASRRPTGPAVLVGPIRDTEDAEELCRWLRAGDLAAARLPGRLRCYARTLARARTN